MSAREHEWRCRDGPVWPRLSRSSSLCPRRRRRRAIGPPRCRSRCGRAARTRAWSTGSPGPGRPPGCGGSRRRAGLAVDGIAGPRTRAALGRLGRHHDREPAAADRNAIGFDVAALQFALETHGFPCGTVDGGFGLHTDAAVRKAQAFYGLTRRRGRRAGHAGRADASAGAGAGAEPADRRGARGSLWAARRGLPSRDRLPRAVRHAGGRGRAGRVIFAGYDDGWGLTVVLDHGNGLHTRYAHLSKAAVSVGASVATGSARGPRRRDRLRHRAAPALRGHDPRRERGPGAGARPVGPRRGRTAPAARAGRSRRTRARGPGASGRTAAGARKRAPSR